jgi:raffinose/stachyose/melibiose transport system permease protein
MTMTTDPTTRPRTRTPVPPGRTAPRRRSRKAAGSRRPPGSYAVVTAVAVFVLAFLAPFAIILPADGPSCGASSCP